MSQAHVEFVRHSHQSGEIKEFPSNLLRHAVSDGHQFIQVIGLGERFLKSHLNGSPVFEWSVMPRGVDFG